MSTSLIITTYNRSNLLRLALESIKQSIIDHENKYEIIIVDNNSSDDTAEIVKPFIGTHNGLEIKYIFEKKQGLSYARNKGISEAQGHFIAFMDDDQTIDPNYLKSLEKAFFETGAACVGGRIFYKNFNDVPDWMIPLVENVGHIDLGPNIVYLDGKSTFLKGGNIAFEKKILMDIGGFDTTLGRKGNELMAAEEDAIQRKLIEIGKKIAYHPDLVQYNILLSEKFLKSYWRRHAFGYGRTCFRISRDQWYTAHKIAGIPISLFINLIIFFGKFFFLALFVNEPLRFRKELDVREAMGAIYEARKIELGE